MSGENGREQMGEAADGAWATIEAINRAWLEGRPGDLRPHFHPDLVMVLPGFSGTAEGAEQMVASFEDMVQNAETESFETSEQHVHQAGRTAVVAYSFAVRYRRGGASYRSTGRDLWVLTWTEGSWKAVWRTMLDVSDEPLDAEG